MVNLFKKGEQHLHKQLNIHGTVDLIYVRDGTESDVILGTPGKTPFVYFDRHGISQRIESRDYIINVADLIVNSVNIKPKEGDLIFEDVDGTRFTYRVSSPGKEPDWRYSGHYRVAFRIHTKLIKEEVI